MSIDEIMAMLGESAKDAEIHVVHMKNDEHKKEESADIYAEKKKEAAELAQLNKILYDAHIAAGFAKNEAFALTRTLLGK